MGPMKLAKEIIKSALRRAGYEIRRLPSRNDPLPLVDLTRLPSKIHYGCGSVLLKDWLNADLSVFPQRGYFTLRANLVGKHPFPDNWFEYGFAEDFLEYLTQAESLVFLLEVFRTLRPGGVLRLSFPGLEGVLQKHYAEPDLKSYQKGKLEAYETWGHVHFYSKEELRTVIQHIGFQNIEFVEYGKSRQTALQNLDTRKLQIGLNTYVEITK
jgi:predicted SAM-dependent methyltransferase